MSFAAAFGLFRTAAPTPDLTAQSEVGLAVDANAQRLAQQQQSESRTVRAGKRLNAAGQDAPADAGNGAGPAPAADPSKQRRTERRTGVETLISDADIPIGESLSGEEEKKTDAPAAATPVEDRPLREVLRNEQIPKQLSGLYLFWIGLESNVTEPITLPSTKVFAESKDAFENAKATVRFGSAPYDEIYIWLMGEEMIPKQLCATVRSVLNTIEQRRALLHVRRIPFWDLFVGQDAVFLSKWITAQHLYNVQSNRSWSGRRENHQALAQITRDAAEYFCTRP